MAIPFVGKIIDSLINKGGDLLSEFITDKDEAARLSQAFKLAVLEDGALERQVEADMFAAQQETIQAELHQNDLYTKRTRPIIARRSFYAGMGYVLLTAIPTAGIDLYFVKLMPWQFQWEVLLLLYSPALAYMGVRGAEKWRSGGSK